MVNTEVIKGITIDRVESLERQLSQWREMFLQNAIMQNSYKNKIIGHSSLPMAVRHIFSAPITGMYFHARITVSLHRRLGFHPSE